MDFLFLNLNNIIPNFLFFFLIEKYLLCLNLNLFFEYHRKKSKKYFVIERLEKIYEKVTGFSKQNICFSFIEPYKMKISDV